MSEYPKLDALVELIKRVHGQDNVLDLRPYWTLKKRACSTERLEGGRQLGWLCTRPKGHDGKHVAHDLDGTLIIAWDA